MIDIFDHRNDGNYLIDKDIRNFLHIIKK